LKPGIQVRKQVGPLTADKAEYVKDKLSWPLLGAILWGSSGTRPDLAVSCGVLSQVQNNPRPEHWDMMVGLCDYIHGTLDYGILLQKPRNEAEMAEPGKGLKPLGYVNSDWAGCVDTQ
jgi:hypothetical protein